MGRKLSTGLVILALPGAGLAQSCTPGWFNPTAPNVLSDVIFDLIEYDLDGPGPQPPRLVAGGAFPLQPAGPGIKYWNGSIWQNVGAGLDGAVYALVSHDDDGPGPNPAALYAGGSFVTSSGGGVPMPRLSRWQDGQWSLVQGGLPNGGPANVQALISLPDDLPGSSAGPALVVGGFITMVGTVPVSHIAALHGSTWSGIGGGLNQQVNALAEYDPDGPGPLPRCLYAGGRFSMAAGTPAAGIARWDGAAWSPLGAGLTGSAYVTGLRSLDLDGPAGAGDVLMVGGQFQNAGGIAARNVAAWNGQAWSALGNGVNVDGGVNDFAMFDADGAGPIPSQLYITGYYLNNGAGQFYGFRARWTGAAWEGISPPVTSGVNQGETLEVVDADGPGGRPAALYFGGRIPDTLPGFTVKTLAAYGCPPCYPDCNNDGLRNLADFGCFQTKFALGDPYADCNSDGIRNLADFGCFTTKFALGCP